MRRLPYFAFRIIICIYLYINPLYIQLVRAIYAHCFGMPWLLKNRAVIKWA